MKEITPSKVLHIKLGRKGVWEAECIERDQVLKLGFDNASHSLCLKKKWEAIREYFLAQDEPPGVARRYADQIREFYEADESTLWITFYRRLLWWCFSTPNVTCQSDKKKTRPVIGRWRSENLNGQQLAFDHLSASLLNKRFFQGTIHGLDDAEIRYVVNRINGRDEHDGQLSLDLEKAASKLEDEGYFSPPTLRDERQRRLGEIVERRGQPKFRSKLMAAYKGRCAMTGSDAVAALEAAHILPYSGPPSDHISNGVLLRADIHALFDLDLIGIDPKTLTVVLRPVLKKTSYSDLEGKPLAVPSHAAFRPNAKALAERWQEFLTK